MCLGVEFWFDVASSSGFVVKLGERLSDRADVGGGTFFLIYVIFNALRAASLFVLYLILRRFYCEGFWF